jgi:hypothetical protein
MAERPLISRRHRPAAAIPTMAWHTSTPGHSTRSIPDIADRIEWSELKPGDSSTG